MKKNKTIQLSRDDCYCGVDAFFENILKKMDIESSADYGFDCRRICVTSGVLDAMMAYYSEVEELPKGSIFTVLMNFGPKASLKGEEYLAVIEDGFVVQREAV